MIQNVSIYENDDIYSLKSLMLVFEILRILKFFETSKLDT